MLPPAQLYFTSKSETIWSTCFKAVSSSVSFQEYKPNEEIALQQSWLHSESWWHSSPEPCWAGHLLCPCCPPCGYPVVLGCDVGTAGPSTPTTGSSEDVFLQHGSPHSCALQDSNQLNLSCCCSCSWVLGARNSVEEDQLWGCFGRNPWAPPRVTMFSPKPSVLFPSVAWVGSQGSPGWGGDAQFSGAFPSTGDLKNLLVPPPSLESRHWDQE